MNYFNKNQNSEAEAERKEKEKSAMAEIQNYEDEKFKIENDKQNILKKCSDNFTKVLLNYSVYLYGLNQIQEAVEKGEDKNELNIKYNVIDFISDKINSNYEFNGSLKHSFNFTKEEFDTDENVQKNIYKSIMKFLLNTEFLDNNICINNEELKEKFSPENIKKIINENTKNEEVKKRYEKIKKYIEQEIYIKQEIYKEQNKRQAQGGKKKKKSKKTSKKAAKKSSKKTGKRRS